MHEAKNQKISDVAVVGGGRWGLVICSVLERILPRDLTIWLLSRHLPADRVPRRVRQIYHREGLPIPATSGAAIIATAPHDHAEAAKLALAAHWHVLIEKPAALTLHDARAVAETAVRMQREAWVGMVYLFAPYLSVLKPYAAGKTRWLLEWCEGDEEMRWGELKSTPHHVNVIEDIFPHAWSILRAAGLTAPLKVQQVCTVRPGSAQLNLTAAEANLELIFDRYAGSRRRFLRIEANDRIYELDFSEEPSTFRIDGIIVNEPPWDPQMPPLASEISTFLATCSGQAAPDLPVTLSRSLEAVALMEDATKVLLEIQANAVAAAVHDRSAALGPVRVLFDALCREAALSGVRLNAASKRALTAAATGFVRGQDRPFAELPRTLETIAARSVFLAQVRQKRKMILAGSR
jgi:hypothetical protein